MTEGWDGRGLPPAAAARIQRAEESHITSSLLSIGGGVGVESVGLRPVGEVMGCMVQRIGWQGWGGCGYYGGGFPFAGGGSMFAGAARTQTTGSGGRRYYGGYAPYVDALYSGYRSALGRMSEEASRLGADGVAGIRLTANRMEGNAREFVAMGTAVRADGEARAPRPFLTDLPGQDLAKLMQGGWVPAKLSIGISVAIRHDDWQTINQASYYNASTEVTGYTELVTQVRADARQQFARDIASTGADGAIVSHMGLHIWSIEPGENHRDHVAECTVIGTAVARFHPGTAHPGRSLMIMPLTTRKRTGRR